jgi:hypothetical protein
MHVAMARLADEQGSVQTVAASDKTRLLMVHLTVLQIRPSFANGEELKLAMAGSPFR